MIIVAVLAYTYVAVAFYRYCLKEAPDGWTAEQNERMAFWFCGVWPLALLTALCIAISDAFIEMVRP